MNDAINRRDARAICQVKIRRNHRELVQHKFAWKIIDRRDGLECGSFGRALKNDVFTFNKKLGEGVVDDIAMTHARQENRSVKS